MDQFAEGIRPRIKHQVSEYFIFPVPVVIYMAEEIRAERIRG